MKMRQKYLLTLILCMPFFWNVVECSPKKGPWHSPNKGTDHFIGEEIDKSPVKSPKIEIGGGQHIPSKGNNPLDEGQSSWQAELSGAKRAAVESETGSPKKKPRKSAIREIEKDATKIDIFLSIVEDNGIYLTKNGQQVWTLIGSDGIEFITIAFWDKYIRDWQSVLGRDLVGKSFRFVDLLSTDGMKSSYNLGSVDIQLKASENCDIIEQELSTPLATTTDFYEFLEKKKMALNRDTFKPMPLPNIHQFHAVGLIDFEATLVDVTIAKQDELIFDVKDGNGKITTVFGWNIVGRFLSQLLRGKEGAILRIQGALLNNVNYIKLIESTKIQILDNKLGTKSALEATSSPNSSKHGGQHPTAKENPLDDGQSSSQAEGSGKQMEKSRKRSAEESDTESPKKRQKKSGIRQSNSLGESPSSHDAAGGSGTQTQTCLKCDAMMVTDSESIGMKGKTTMIIEPEAKPKRSPIGAIRDGETTIAIELTIVEDNEVYIASNGNKIWTLIGSDGVEFIMISLWDISHGSPHHLRKYRTQLGNDFLNKTFRFFNFSSKSVPPKRNLGSVAIQIQAKPGSEIIPVKNRTSPFATYINYFNFLKSNCALDAMFSPTPLLRILDRNRKYDIEAQLVEINPIKNINWRRNDEKSEMFKFIVWDGKTVVVKGFHIFARFLFYLLCGKEGSFLKLHNVFLRREGDFVFEEDSKIFVDEKKRITGNTLPASLHDLIGIREHVRMNLRLKIAQPQSDQSFAGRKHLDGTICHDSNKHKLQLRFPKNMRFEVGQEFTMVWGRPVWTVSGVLTITISGEADIIRHLDTVIGTVDLLDLHYPGRVTTLYEGTRRTGMEIAKKSPIRAIVDGETMINIELYIVAEAVMITNNNTKVWSLVGSDGVDFVTISFLRDSVDHFRQQLGKYFTSSINITALINEDISIDVCKFLKRKCLASLELSCAYFHRLIFTGGYFRALHFTHGTLVVALPSSEIRGFFKHINHIPERMNFQAHDMDEVAPVFVRCRNVIIHQITDERIIQYLERMKHVFCRAFTSVDIVAPLNTRLSHWNRLLETIHATCDLRIKALIPDGCKPEFDLLREKLSDTTKRLRRNELTLEQHGQQFNALLEEFKKKVKSKLDEMMNPYHHDCYQFQQIGRALAKWFLCRCGCDNGKKPKHAFLKSHILPANYLERKLKYVVLSLHDHSHLMVQTVREMAVLTDDDLPPLRRSLNLTASSIYVKDLIRDVPDSINFVNTRARVQGEKGKMMQIEICEEIYDYYGAVYVRFNENFKG